MKILLTTYLLLLSGYSFSQEPITLQACLDEAQANSLQLTEQTSSIRSAQIDRNFHAWSLLPNLSAFTGFNTSFGRRVDPFTNTFATTTVNSQTFGLNTSMPLFSGFSYVYRRNLLNVTIRQNEIALAARQNDLKIQVINTYIELCKLSTQIDLSEKRIDKLVQVQGFQRALIDGGKINTIDTLRSHNTLITEKTLLMNLKSDYRLKNIELNYLIGEPLSTLHTFVLSSISEITNKPLLPGLYELEKLEAEGGRLEQELKVDRASVLPNLSLNGLIGTGFSTNNKDYLVSGNPTKRYNDQIAQNLYEGIGLYLSIPIFNRGTWLKSRELYSVQQSQLENEKRLTELTFEKQRLEMEQQLLLIRAEQEQILQMTANLQTIYDKTVLLYEEGRTTYTELEVAFMSWQTELIELESKKLDYERLKLYE